MPGRACGESPLTLESALQAVELLRRIDPATTTLEVPLVLVEACPNATMTTLLKSANVKLAASKKQRSGSVGMLPACLGTAHPANGIFMPDAKAVSYTHLTL